MAKTNLKKNKSGYGYKYTELSEIHNYLEENDMKYYQEIQTCPENGFDYIMTYRYIDGKWEDRPIRGCKVADAVLSGKNNPAQEQGSALTYARRYSLLMAFGLATSDDDGNGANNKPNKKENQKQDEPNANDLVQHQQLENILFKLVEENKVDIEKMCKTYKVEDIHLMTIKQYQNAIANIDKLEKVAE